MNEEKIQNKRLKRRPVDLTFFHLQIFVLLSFYFTFVSFLVHLKYLVFFQFFVVVHSVMSDSATPWTTAHQASLSITISPSLHRLMSIESVMTSNHLILCHLVSSCPQSFPVPGSFLTSQPFASGGQSIGVTASASVLPMKIQH